MRLHVHWLVKFIKKTRKKTEKDRAAVYSLFPKTFVKILNKFQEFSIDLKSFRGFSMHFLSRESVHRASPLTDVGRIKSNLS